MDDLLDSIEQTREREHYARFDPGGLSCACGSGLHVRDCDCLDAEDCRDLRTAKTAIQLSDLDERDKEAQMLALDLDIRRLEAKLS
jgi:hypothetical protein